MNVIKCANGPSCSYGRTIETDDGRSCVIPENAYSQQGNTAYRGLCLNCLDDELREEQIPDMEDCYR